MLVYHQAIHYPILTSNLMCLMQIQTAGVIINELPKFLVEDPNKKTHSIIFDDTLNLNEPMVILLELKAVTSYLPSMNPRVS